MNLINDLVLSIKSRYSLIYIQTQEEETLLASLRDACKQNNYEFTSWNFAKDDKDPLSFLQALNKDGKGVIVLQDAHTFLNDNSALGSKFRRHLRNKTFA